MKKRTDRFVMRESFCRPVRSDRSRTSVKDVLVMLLSCSLYFAGCSESFWNSHFEKNNKEKEELTFEEKISSLCENGFYEGEGLFEIQMEEGNRTLLDDAVYAALQNADYEMAMQVRIFEGRSKEEGRTDWTEKENAAVLTARRDVEIPELDTECTDFIQYIWPSRNEITIFVKVLSSLNDHVLRQYEMTS